MALRRYLQEQRHPRPDSRRKMGNSASIMGWSLLTKDMLKATSTIMISLKISGWKGGKLDEFKPLCNLGINRLQDVLLGAEGFCRMVLIHLVTSRRYSIITTKNPGGTHWICEFWVAIWTTMMGFPQSWAVLPGFGTASSTCAMPPQLPNKWPLAVQQNGIESSPLWNWFTFIEHFQKGEEKGMLLTSQRE